MRRLRIEPNFVLEAVCAFVVAASASLLWASSGWAFLTMVIGIALGTVLSRSNSVLIGGSIVTAGSLLFTVVLDLPSNYLLNWTVLVIVTGLLPYALTRGWMIRGLAMKSAESAVQARSIARRNAIESAYSEEKRRIAEELHDELGHQLSLTSVQINALSLDDSLTEKQRKALADMNRRLRESVSTLAHTVEILRDGAPAPTSPVSTSLSSAGDDLPEPSGTLGKGTEKQTAAALLAEAESAGTRVTITVGDREQLDEFPAGSLVGKVLREGLTNALKHAPGQVVGINLGFDSAQLLMSMDNDMPTDSTHRTLGAGTGISSLKSAVEAQGGDLDQIIETDQHELRLSLPLTAPARGHEPQANSTPLGSDDDPSVELGAARMRGNKRLAIAAALPLAALCLVIGAVVLNNWWHAERSLLSADVLKSLSIGMSTAQTQRELPDEEYTLISNEERQRANEGAPPGSTCRFYALTADQLSDRSGDLARLCFSSGELVSIDTIVTGVQQ
ncbi:MAG TPA: histidine kinase [Brevibacterium epidermidis]|uniref:histidine kinase n=1 Tax=Brevibacterium epidermidis TaxID=1698 RepID=A0A9D2ZWI8_BREEP|nr:histidine kinase [Brevibacterium epidermidis]